MIKSKKQMFIVLGVFTLVLMLGTITYAFFNYTRTGTANTIKVGRISFITRQTETINLTNVFPIDKVNVDTDTDNVDEVVIEIEGDTDYAGGIEYLVSSKDANIYTNQGTQVPVSLDITVEDLGTSSPNYFTSRDDTITSIYKQLVGSTLLGDQRLLVGYIVPNNPTGTIVGIDGSITIKAYFDKDLLKISDTYDGSESDNMGTTNEWAEGKTVITTAEWNALQSSGVSFKVKVEANEGIWVKDTLDNIIRTKNLNTSTNQPIKDNEASEFVNSPTGINFATYAYSGNYNGKGIYMKADTQDDAYPILYYRGEVTDNNVVFADRCWKIIRTTDTGGVKLIHNGLPTDTTVYSDVVLGKNKYNILTNTTGFVFNNNDNTYTSSINQPLNYEFEFSFNVADDGEYKMYLTKDNSPGGGAIYLYKNDEQVLSSGIGNGGSITKDFGTILSSDKIRVNFNGGGFSESEPGTIKIKMVKVVSSIQKTCKDNARKEAMISIDGRDSFPFNNDSNSISYIGYMYGDVYEYHDGTKSGTYWSDIDYANGVYTLKVGGTTSASLDETHHYICEESANCTKVRYYYYNGNGSKYIELENGDTLNNAIAKMQENNTSSIAKIKIDSWYESNLINYTDKLEDTVWCNDRSMNINDSGWNPNGGDLSSYLYYSAYERYQNRTPSLVCRKNDSFTVSNAKGNKKLQYPIAILTSDEIMLAGGGGYLYNSYESWLLSPYYYNGVEAHNFRLYTSYLDHYKVNDQYAHSLRPSISLKIGTTVAKGDGTFATPYEIES